MRIPGCEMDWRYMSGKHRSRFIRWMRLRERVERRSSDLDM